MHSFTNLLIHVIFSTKERARVLADEIRPDLLAYMGGILRELNGTALIINGTEDHVYMLLRLPGDVHIAEYINSSRWVHETFPHRATYAWQRGYGAFSVSKSNRWATFFCRLRRLAYVCPRPKPPTAHAVSYLLLPVGWLLSEEKVARMDPNVHLRPG
jgi:putative transposase